MPEPGEVRLWVRPEVLELAILPVLPPDKISVEMLSRLIQYARDLGERGYPTMTYETWKHIAVKKMGLGAECCEVMFCSCRLFSQRSVSSQEDTLSCDSTVWTLELVTLLYLQRITNAHPRIMARQASLISLTNDPWPGASPSAAAANGSATGGAASVSSCASMGPATTPAKKKLPEEYHLEFIKDSLSELLSLLAGHLLVEESQTRAQKRRSGDWRSVRELLGLMRGAGVVGVEVVRAMDLVLGVTLGDRSGAKLLDVATDKTFCYQSGFLSKKNTFQKGLFEQWLLSRLDWAPHGEWLCTRRGAKLPSWPVVSASHHYRLHSSPAPQHTGERLVCITDLLEGITVQLGDASVNTTPKKHSAQHSRQVAVDRAAAVDFVAAVNNGGDFSVNAVNGHTAEPTASIVDAVNTAVVCSAKLALYAEESKKTRDEQVEEVDGCSRESGSSVDGCSRLNSRGHSEENETLQQNERRTEVIGRNNVENSEFDRRNVENLSGYDTSEKSDAVEIGCRNNVMSNSSNGFFDSNDARIRSNGTNNIISSDDKQNTSDMKDGQLSTKEAGACLNGSIKPTLSSKPDLRWSPEKESGVTRPCIRRTFSESHAAADGCRGPLGSPVRRALSVSGADVAASPPVLLDIKIRRCSKSQVYILQPLRHVLLQKLYDCKVVLGPVRGRLRVQECRNLTVVAPARSIVISDSRNLTVFTVTPQRPLLVGGVSPVGLSAVTAHQGVTLAPLNMHYPRLLQHLHATGLNTHPNKWNNPLRLGNDGRCEQSECGILAPEEFQLLALPFFQATVDGRPPLLPPGLPPPYVQSVEASQQVVCSLRAEVREASLTAEHRSLLQRAIDQRFKVWLRENNKQRELDLLDKLAAKLSKERTVAGTSKLETAAAV